MSGASNEIVVGPTFAAGAATMVRASPSHAGVSSLNLPGGSLPPTAAGHLLEDDDLPRAARDVAAGEPWVDFTHRTVAEADRQTAERMRGGPGRAFAVATFQVPGWVPADLREDYVDLALQCGEEHAASVVRGLKRVANGGVR